MKKEETYSAPMLVAGADGTLHVNYGHPKGMAACNAPCVATGDLQYDRPVDIRPAP